MKLAFFLLALGVCINAASISNELVESKFELPSVSALLVTELLEATFHVPADLAQAIGHLFRDVPISLAKEMIAFVVKVFGDLTHGHLDALNQYMEQAIHIFSQVVQHINPKEVAALIAEEVLPEHWVAIVEKLIYSLGRRAAEKGVVVEYLVDEFIVKPLTGFITGLFGKRELKGDIIDTVIDAVIDTLIEELTSWTLGLLGGLFGKRSVEKGVVVDYLVDEFIVKPLTGFISGLFGKRSAEKGVIIDAVVDTLIEEITSWTLGLLGALFGKRTVEKGVVVDYLVDEFIVKPLTGFITGLFGKRSAEEKGLLGSIAVSVGISLLGSLIGKRQTTGDYWDEFVGAVVDWGVSVIENVVTSVVTGFFGLFGKRDLKGWGIIDAVVDTLIDELTSWTVSLIGGLFGKRSAEEKGLLGSIAISVATNLIVGAITGKRQTTGDYWDEFVGAVVDWGVSVIESAVTSVVTGFFGLFGKRDLKGWGIIDAVVDTLIDELTSWTVSLIGGLFGKRSAEEKGLLTSIAISVATNLLVGAITGKRQTTGDYWDEFVGAVVDWGVSVIESAVTSVVTGFFGLFGKRSAEKGVVVDYLVDEFIVKPLTGFITGLFGKRQAPVGF